MNDEIRLLDALEMIIGFIAICLLGLAAAVVVLAF